MANEVAVKATMTFPKMLEAYRGEVERALPKHLTADRMIRIALTEFNKNPRLKECQPSSVMSAVIQASQLGLEVGLMGDAYIVPFKNKDGSYECQLIPGFLGLMKLARNTGKIDDIYAHAVREKDEFEVSFGLHRDLVHKPKMSGSFPASDADRGEVVGYYAVAVFTDGKRSFNVMSQADVLKVRDKSLGYRMSKKFNKQSIWDEYEEEMGLKTVIRRLCKYLPKSPEMATAEALDTAIEVTGKQGLTLQSVTDGTWQPSYEDKEGATDISQIEYSIDERFMTAFLPLVPISDEGPMFHELVKFVEYTASRQEVPTSSESIKEDALKNSTRFMTAFHKWLNKANKPQEPQKPEEPKSEWDEFRASFVNLKTSGYSTFVYRNLGKFKECPEELRREAIEKWVKLYPAQAWPEAVAEAARKEASEPSREEVYEPPKGEPVALGTEHAPPISFSKEYKDLATTKSRFPEHYSISRLKLAIGPDTIPNCIALEKHTLELAYAEKREREIVDEQIPLPDDTSGF